MVPLETMDLCLHFAAFLPSFGAEWLLSSSESHTPIKFVVVFCGTHALAPQNHLSDLTYAPVCILLEKLSPFAKRAQHTIHPPPLILRDYLRRHMYGT